MIFVRQIFLGDHHIDNCHCNISSNVYSAPNLDTTWNEEKPKALFRFLALYLFREKVLQSKNVFVFGLWCINGNWQLFLSFTMCEFRTISKAFWSFFLAIKWPNFRPKVLVWNFTVGKFKTISYLSLTFSANFRTNLISYSTIWAILDSLISQNKSHRKFQFSTECVSYH